MPNKYLKEAKQICTDGSHSLIIDKHKQSHIRLSTAPFCDTFTEGSNKPIYIGHVKMHPSYSVAYAVREGGQQNINHQSMKQVKRFTGELSKKAMQRLKNVIRWLEIISYDKKVFSKATRKTYSFKLAFITLTLSSKQEHSDEWIKRNMLYPFLLWSKRNFNCVSYVWKAEAQSNGNIHFHIIVNKFIHHKAIRKKWNSIQQQAGYTFKGNEINPINDPPSTEIKAVKKSKQIVSYMMKYFTKNEKDKRKINGRIWGCSDNLLNSSIVISQLDEEYNMLQTFLHDSRINAKIQYDHVSVFVPLCKSSKYLPEPIKQRWKELILKANQSDNGQTFFTTE